MSKLIEIYSAANAPEAHLLANRLTDEGISARIVGETLLVGAGELPVGYATSPKVWVRAEDAEMARALLTKWEHERKTTRPETAWKCPICTAEVDAGFEVCWSCQRWREDTEPTEAQE